jgi:hypothetical protein
MNISVATALAAASQLCGIAVLRSDSNIERVSLQFVKKILMKILLNHL